MHVLSDLGGPGQAPVRPPGTKLAASVDVEWSKNYRVKNGNRAFCYSILWFVLLDSDDMLTLDQDLHFWFTCVYLDADSERAELIQMAAADLATALSSAELIAGHQLCSDLAVLVSNAGPRVPAALTTARQAWHDRRIDPNCPVFDTRFDAGHLLSGSSRRLVDVCSELDLDVEQPELGSSSMTALHRNWLDRGDTEARERVTVLNLRHSLSTALVALRAAGTASWAARLNANEIIVSRLRGRIGWLDHPTFQALVSTEAVRWR